MFKIILIYCIIIKISIINAQQAINCQENSFNITLISSDVEYTFLNLTYSIKLSNNIGPVSNQAEYAGVCLKSIIFKYKPVNSLINETITELRYNGSLISSIQFLNLTYLTQYEFRISYKQFVNSLNADKEYEIDHLKSHKIYTCFGRPGFVENFKPNVNYLVSISSNGTRTSSTTVEATWQKPKVINAPDVCYYQYALVDYANYNFKSGIIMNYYKIDKLNMSSNSTFYFAVFNDASCYIDKYPFVKDCKYSKLNSKFYVSKNFVVDIESFTIIEEIDFVDLDKLEKSVTTTTKSSTTTKTSSLKPFNSGLKIKGSLISFILISLPLLIIINQY